MQAPPLNPAFVLLQSASGAALDCVAEPAVSDAAVHTARKALKQARAALRLLRPALAERDYRSVNRCFRDAGRLLAPLRDARALLATIARVTQHDASAARALSTLAAALRVELEQQRRGAAELEQRRHCAALIESARERVSRRPVAQADGEVLHRGLHKIYRSTRRAWRAACNDHSPECLHEWRKQTKYLRTAAKILSDAGVRGLRKTVTRAERIADLLGEAHDLAVLEAAVRERVAREEQGALLAHIERRRKKFEKRALAAAEKLLVEKADDFGPPAQRYAKVSRVASSGAR